MSKFRFLSISVSVFCLMSAFNAYAQLEPELEVTNSTVVGDIEEDGVSFSVPREIKAKIGEGKMIQVTQFMNRKGNFHMAFRFIDAKGPQIEFKYLLDEHGISLIEVSTFRFDDSHHYIKKVHNPKNGNIVRIITRDLDENDEAFENIIREEAGKGRIKNVIMETKEQGKTTKTMIRENSKLFEVYPEENMTIILKNNRSFYVVDGHEFSFNLKPNTSSATLGFAMDFLSQEDDVKLYIDYKDKTVEDVRYPTIKLVSAIKGVEVEVISKSLYEYNTNIDVYELSDVQVKETMLNKNDNTVADKFREGRFYNRVSKADLITGLLSYLTKHTSGVLYLDKKMEDLVEDFNKYIVEDRECVLGQEEKAVLFGIDGKGGLYDYFIQNLGIPYYYNMAILYGALSNNSGLIKDRCVSTKVISAFEDMGLITVTDVTSMIRLEEMEVSLGVQFNDKGYLRFSEGMIKYGRGLIKK